MKKKPANNSRKKAKRLSAPVCDRGLIDLIRAIVLVLDRDGKIVSFNPYMEELSGYSLKEVQGRDWFSVFLEKEKAAPTRALFAKAIGGQPTRGNVDVIVAKDGRKLSIEWYDMALKDSQGRVKGLVSVGQDVSGRSRAESALLETEQNYRMLFDHARDAVLLLDLPPKGLPVIRNVNPAAIKMFGYTREEIIGKDVSLLNADPEEGRKVSDEQEKLSDHFFEIKHRRKDGSVFTAEVSAKEMRVGDRRMAVSMERDITERDRLLASLRKGEERFAQVAEASRTFLWEVDREGLYTYISDSVRSVCGYSADSLVGKMHFYDIHPEGGRNEFKRAALSAFELRRPFTNFVNPIMSSSGGIVWVATTGVPVLGHDGELLGYRGSDVDITEHKRMQEALRQSEEKYRQLAEGTSDIPYTIDAQGNLTFIGPQVARMGLDQVKMVGRPFLEFVHPDDRAGLMDEFSEFIGNGRPFISEFRIVDSEGGSHWMEELGNLQRDKSGAVTGIVGMLRDITERKIAEESLLESKALMDTVIENVPLMVFLKRADDLRFVLFNRAGEKLLGYEGKSMIGKNDMDFFPPEQAECFMSKDREVLKVKGFVDIPEEPITNSKNERRWLHTRKVTIRGIDGKAKYLLGISEDITERKLAEKERDEMRNRLTQSQKMESVGRLAGGLAHDFNNLLTTIDGYAGLLLQNLAADDPRRSDVQEILNAAQRAAGVTRQLLAFGRRQMLNPQVIDLNSSLESMIKILQRLSGENIKVETRLTVAPCRIKVDPGQLDQVIVNLVINARDAMPKGGMLTFETANVRPPESFFRRHPDMKKGALACLTVRDTGVGMSEEVKNHLFEPFFTTKEKGKGTGLGLSMVYGVVKQSGGEVEVESAPGAGTIFRIYLPQSEDRPIAREDDARKDEIVRGNETILFVEDEESLRRLGERILKMCGYTVISAIDGPSAIAAAERHEKPVDLLLTDVVMPGMSGRDLALELDRRKLALKTLYMSGYAEDAVVDHGVLSPDIAFIYKPFTAKDLSDKLRKVLDGPAQSARP